MYGHHGYEYGATSDPSVRAADADREATADRLRHEHAIGRIDVSEFQERLDRTFQAKTIGELRELVRDLPRDDHPGRLGLGRGLGGGRGRLWMFPWIPIVLAIVAVSAISGHHHHSGLWVLIPLFFLARFLFGGHRPWTRRYRTPQV